MGYPKRNLPPLSRLYHVNSRLTSARPFYVSPVAQKAMAGAFSSFPGRPVVTADSSTPCDGELDRIFDQRNSTTRFTGTLEKQQLFDTIIRATRINRASEHEELVTSQRVYPSPGGLYPIELYVLPLTVVTVAPATYHWDVLENRLEQLWSLPEFDTATAVPGIQPSTDVPAALIALTVYFPRIEWKYGDRSYRFALMEAAAIASNLQLVCAQSAIASRWIGGFQDEWWDAALRLDGDQETTVLTFALG